MIKCEVNIMARGTNDDFIKKNVKKIFKFLKIKNTAISIAVVGDKEMRGLNKKYRGKNKTTDILSFGERDTKDFIKIKDAYLGELVISFPEIRRQAKKEKKTIKNLLKKNLIHGILHLLGYEHEKGEGQAEEMFELQEKILKNIND